MTDHILDLGGAKTADGYRPERCDFCGSRLSRPVLALTGRAMTSDGRIVASDILKIECDDCGLVRSGHAISMHELSQHYVSDYRHAAASEGQEPLVRQGDSVVPRSEAIAQWLIDGWKSQKAPPPSQIVEIGCGDGRVLERLGGVWTAARLFGVEPNTHALAVARGRGLMVGSCAPDTVGDCDLVYSVAVIEHVASPRAFMAEMASLMAPNGLLISIQPCQDDPSHDLFFVDHLHHFMRRHIAQIGAAEGLKEVFQSYPNPYLPHFSMHVFARSSRPVRQAKGPECNSRAAEAVALWMRRFVELNVWLAETATRRLSVWGLGEAFALLCAYSDLGDTAIALGFDDNLLRFQNAGFGFPVETFHGDLDADRDRLLVTFRPNRAAAARLNAVGVPWHSIAGA